MSLMSEVCSSLVSESMLTESQRFMKTLMIHTMVRGLGATIAADLIQKKTTNAYNVVVNGNDIDTISEALGPSHFHLQVSDMVVMSTVLFFYSLCIHTMRATENGKIRVYIQRLGEVQKTVELDVDSTVAQAIDAAQLSRETLPTINGQTAELHFLLDDGDILVFEKKGVHQGK